MAETVSVGISDPISTAIRAGADVVVAVFSYATEVRSTMSQESRDATDRINSQAYWDFRRILQAAGIVGDPEPWPPKKDPSK